VTAEVTTLPSGEVVTVPVSGAEELRPFLLTPTEWTITVAAAAGAGMMLFTDLLGGNPRWARWGGALLTATGAVTAIVTLRRHTTAKKALAP
jgi:hypothetical protein